MRVISKKALVTFWTVHPDAASPLTSWHTIITKTEFANPIQIKAVFPRADFLKDDVVIFDIGGRGKGYRISARFVYKHYLVYVRHVMTHDEYLWLSKQGKL
jgi:mRNA interferase HigB